MADSDAQVIRKRRANGEASRQRILDAAAEIAGERGYEGTSINLVSVRSGLPVSSIYWHFKDKDELIAAVIDRSFTGWIDILHTPLTTPPSTSDAEIFRVGMRRTGVALGKFSDFLRLGLMLILEQRPTEPTARTKFIEARQMALTRTATLYSRYFADLDQAAVGELAMLTIALADGLFIASEVEGVPLEQSFDLLATTIQATAERLRTAT